MANTITAADTFVISAPDFKHQATIPSEYTCEGADISPQLIWQGVPPEAKSLALIVDDPDAPDPAAPKRTWVHWVLYNIPATARELPKGVSAEQLPLGTLQGTNDWNLVGYGGPCPPIGAHRYFHKLYALNILLPDLGEPDKAALLKAMEPHIIAMTEIVGVYKKLK